MSVWPCFKTVSVFGIRLIFTNYYDYSIHFDSPIFFFFQKSFWSTVVNACLHLIEQQVISYFVYGFVPGLWPGVTTEEQREPYWFMILQGKKKKKLKQISHKALCQYCHMLPFLVFMLLSVSSCVSAPIVERHTMLWQHG